MHQQQLITAEWRRFESLRGCLSEYLEKSEEEFSRLIQALIAYGEMEEQVRKATGRACEIDGDARIDQNAAMQALTGGYTMREQHEVHASVSGVEITASYARLSEVVEGDDYGDNVELF